MNWQIREFLKEALAEDLGRGDITSEVLIPEDLNATASFLFKEEGVVCGIPMARELFELLQVEDFEVLHPDGQFVPAGTVVAKIRGSARSLLAGERLALNIMQHLSGIATRTKRWADLIAPYNAKLTDTRKTTPLLRLLEKHAVRVGGGKNHRFGLDDAVLIKDNHLALVDIKTAVLRAREVIPHTMKIEVEAENPQQVREALEAGADIIMLDNMPPEQMTKMVELIAGRAIVEASGGINENTLVQVAQTGVDFISVGSLTHSVKAIDISLNFD
jgi:nicotinate-nucleotide pyrophosphorylase (carboxylating)